MPPSNSKLKLPKIRKVSLNRFSLFTANPNAEFECGDGVLCLIGANGIGKSTLLSAINFCLTGIVPDPNRALKSMEEYYRYSRVFSSRYFRGRIDGSDEDEAEITVSFRLGSYDYELRRGMFEPDELRGFTVTNCENDAVVLETEGVPRGERHDNYTSRFVEDSGVSTFEEYAFLQHFVFSFDEQRKTLFWNQRVLERALYRAFGLEPDMAKNADAIRREIEKEDSTVRNRQWEISRKTKRINEIIKNTADGVEAKERLEVLMGDHESLTHQYDEEEKVLRETEDALKNAHVRLANLAVRNTALRDEYARLFNKRLELRPPLSQHPLVIQSFNEHTCALCGDKSDQALIVIRERVEAEKCPLCDSDLHTKSAAPTDTGDLQRIDRELARTAREINDVLITLEKLKEAERSDRKKFDATRQKLAEFDKQNSATIEYLRQTLKNNGSNKSLSIYSDELALLETEKKAAYRLRENLKKELLDLQSDLEEMYRIAETEFVPRFTELANRFLGMPLSVQMNSNINDGLNLVVSVRGNPRPLQHHLSESQRFFLDIALRMALTEQMSDLTARGGMYIDTPEGSLDIAYEKRAGDMLAMFSASGHQILMTANLNSSQLLLALAERCGQQGMKICRMTDWAELSDVQKEEEDLFIKAFQDIEKAMELYAE